jgi:superfamily I DNA and RNA helicase
VKGAKTLRDKVNLKQIPWNQIHVMKNWGGLDSRAFSLLGRCSTIWGTPSPACFSPTMETSKQKSEELGFKINLEMHETREVWRQNDYKNLT